MTHPLPGPESPPPPPPGPSPLPRGQSVLRVVDLVAQLLPGVLVAVSGCALIGFALGGVLWH